MKDLDRWLAENLMGWEYREGSSGHFRCDLGYMDSMGEKGPVYAMAGLEAEHG